MIKKELSCSVQNYIKNNKTHSIKLRIKTDIGGLDVKQASNMYSNNQCIGIWLYERLVMVARYLLLGKSPRRGSMMKYWKRRN